MQGRFVADGSPKLSEVQSAQRQGRKNKERQFQMESDEENNTIVMILKNKSLFIGTEFGILTVVEFGGASIKAGPVPAFQRRLPSRPAITKRRRHHRAIFSSWRARSSRPMSATIPSRPANCPAMIKSVHATLGGLSGGAGAETLTSQKPAVTDQEIDHARIHRLPGRRQEAEDAQALSALALRALAGGLSREMGPARRLSDGRAELRRAALGIRQEDRAGPLLAAVEEPQAGVIHTGLNSRHAEVHREAVPRSTHCRDVILRGPAAPGTSG